tara:strand:- start:5700 stop:6845 length:1146 start_codon:yes stop_codon:yes gene_type:complete
MASYSNPSTTTSFEQPYADAMRRGFLESAFGLAQTPTPVAVQQYAGLDPYEMQARTLAGGLGGFTPYIQQGGQMMQEGLGVARQGQGALAGAQNMYGQGAGLVNQGAGLYGQGTGLVGQGTGLYGLGTQLTGQASDYYRPGAASSFYNPYEQGVVQQTLSDLQERNAKQGIADRSQAVSRGAFGGSRGRLMEQERERAFGRGAAEAIGGIRSKGFEGARSAAMTAGQGLGALGGQLGSFGQGLGQLGGQLGSFGSGLGQLGGQYGQFGSGLSNVAGQYRNLGTGIAGLGTNFAGLGTTGQSNLLRQINAFEGLGKTGRGIQNQMYGAQFDAANRLAAEPQKRLAGLQSMLGMLPTTRSTTRFGAEASDDNAYNILKLLGLA